MRKHQQRQILEILQTLYEAQAAGMYADCQEAAIGVGGFIEEIVGEGTQTVALLEDYCEMLFQASNGETGEKQLRKQLVKIENSVKNALKPDKIEVAFLPYNLSMWDSLESIYLAAREDKNCDAYVVPLPYYDFDDETKTLGEKMHYDGDKYPPNITVTHWQAYDIEERRPDVTFIHYAYDDDGNNFSVPPEFYSKRLREHCELLIYVPYYVSREEWIPQYFANLPGVLFSHYVIVQSEAVRQVYIDHFNKSAKEYGFGEKYGKAKDKFLALGSPKFDKVINTKREDCPLPEKWERLITKPDGTNKKIILYNTHMFAWINNAEQYFKKIRSVFDTFRGRDAVVLWWRPHPGTELNFQKHLPKMLGEYYAVVNEYQEGNVGIYDDTPDLHRAITWSDAYYGDWSSLVVMYGMTGKPIMIGNPDALQGEASFEPTCIYANDDSIWFSVRRINALLKMDKDDWKLELVGSFPSEEDYIAKHNNSLYLWPAENSGILYFPPFLAKEIAVYSVSNGSFEKIKYKENDEKPASGWDFAYAVAHGEYVYFTPFQYPAIVRLNVKTKKLAYYSDWLEPLAKLSDNNKQAAFVRPLVVRNTIYLASRMANAVVAFDMETGASVVSEVGEKSCGYSGMCFDGENYWLSPRYGTKTPIVKWHPKRGVMKEFSEIYASESDKGFRLLCCGGHVWAIPIAAAHAYKIDPRTDAIEVAEEFDSANYATEATYGDSIYAYNQQTCSLVEYNTATKARREEAIRYSPEIEAQLEPLFAKSMEKSADAMKTIHGCYYYEGGDARLEAFAEHIISSGGEAAGVRRAEIARSAALNDDGTAGGKIYEFAKKTMLG